MLAEEPSITALEDDTVSVAKGEEIHNHNGITKVVCPEKMK
jgi:hypothetical protein